MGFFDILNYVIKCSKCRKQREWEIQIKTFVDDIRNIDDYPKYFKVNNKIITNDGIIRGYGCCPICNTHRDILIKVKNNKISKNYEFDNRNF